MLWILKGLIRYLSYPFLFLMLRFLHHRGTSYFIALAVISIIKTIQVYINYDIYALKINLDVLYMTKFKMSLTLIENFTLIQRVDYILTNYV